MAMTDAPTACAASTTEPKLAAETEEKTEPPQGVSILKEVFPERATSPEPAKARTTNKLPLQLFNSIPSPARACAGRNFAAKAQMKNMPCGPPAHAPAPVAAPRMPPPPPVLPPQAFQHGQEQQSVATMLALEPSSTSYRERLRAGGRGAFQRAMDAGFVPKNMKQDWAGLQTSSTPAQGFLPKTQADGNQGGMMQYSTLGDSQQMWNAAGQCSPMAQPQMQPQSQPMMQMAPPMPPQMMMQPEVSTPTAAAQTDLDRCMAIVMPQVGQFPCDRELMAAQLKAAADCQCYQD